MNENINDEKNILSHIFRILCDNKFIVSTIKFLFAISLNIQQELSGRVHVVHKVFNHKTIPIITYLELSCFHFSLHYFPYLICSNRFMFVYIWKFILPYFYFSCFLNLPFIFRLSYTINHPINNKCYIRVVFYAITQKVAKLLTTLDIFIMLVVLPQFSGTETNGTVIKIHFLV